MTQNPMPFRQSELLHSRTTWSFLLNLYPSFLLPSPTSGRRLLATAAAVLGLLGCSAPPSVHAESTATDGPAAAAEATASGSRNCKAIGNFYWEIGDGKGAIVSGAVGDEYSANKEISIASASKFVWGAYVLEKIGKNRQPDERTVEALTMRAGFTAFNPIACLLTRTVEACAANRSNGLLAPGDVGRFSYGGGHDQRLAVDLGLGRYSADQLTREVRTYLGNDLGLSYKRPQLAGGLEGSPAAYAGFLRKIINGQLRMHDFLGADAVCTLPGRCPGALVSPVKEAWHYSLNHWVEDDPRTGDGSFSSPGLQGFYPWISADKKTYGIVAREELRANAYWASVECGRDIRKAYFSGKAVP